MRKLYTYNKDSLKYEQYKAPKVLNIIILSVFLL